MTLYKVVQQKILIMKTEIQNPKRIVHKWYCKHCYYVYEWTNVNEKLVKEWIKEHKKQHRQKLINSIITKFNK